MRRQRCKGTRDLLLEEMRRFRFIESVFKDSCLKWGYEEVRTPTLEYLHLFTSTGTLTPNKLSRVYSFLDWDGWSGERVVLRPDGTIPIARLYIDAMEDKKLAKLFYVTNVFVFEETGKDTREKWQCGAEFLGSNSSLSDIELIKLTLEILGKLGITNVILKLSHAGLIKSLLLKFELEPEEQTRIFNQILDGDDKVLTVLEKDNPEISRNLTPLLELKGKSSGYLKNIKSLFEKDSPELIEPLNDFISVVDLLETLGIKYQIDITSGRGFEYYTGIIFQFLAGKEHIGGGGRYDELIPLMGGKEIPASGFALYLDKLMDIIKINGTNIPPIQKVMINVNTGKPVLTREAFNLATQLHKNGYLTELYTGEKETTGFKWTIEIQEKTTGYKITDQINNKKYEARTMDEVLKILKS